MKLYQAISQSFQGMITSDKFKNPEWYGKHYINLKKLCQMLPHGAGIDSTTPEELCGFDEGMSRSDKLVINCSFHHMNEDGYYDGWTDHRIIVTPSFNGINIDVKGKNRNDIKGYLYDVYYTVLTEEIKEN